MGNRLIYLQGITHIVQVLTRFSGGGQGWETIAAFNCDVASQAYALRCGEGKPDVEYRVLPLKKPKD